MWPRTVDWEELRFGVEIEFVGGNPAAVELLPGWVMALDELQVDDTGEDSGAELKPPPLLWRDREQMRVMLDRLKATGARANWSCGLHVHVGLEPWGQDIVLPLVDAALAHQDALRGLLRTAEDRLIHCPPVVPAMRDRYLVNPERASLVRRGRPQSHRCGINAAAWFDFGTVEIRYPNGSLEYDEVVNTVELCLRFVAAVGAGRLVPPAAAGATGGGAAASGPAACAADAAALAALLGAPADGYPLPRPAPRWHRERAWLEDALVPVLEPLVRSRVPEAEILAIRPVPGGFRVTAEEPGDRRMAFLTRPGPDGWSLEPLESERG